MIIVDISIVLVQISVQLYLIIISCRVLLSAEALTKSWMARIVNE